VTAIFSKIGKIQRVIISIRIIIARIGVSIVVEGARISIIGVRI